MTQLVIGKPFATSESQLTVDPGFQPGRHRFGLIVFGATGAKSAQDEVLVTVSADRIVPVPPTRPT